MRETKQKVVLVTGASSGIGKACAKMLLRNGWLVYGTSRQVHQQVVEVQDGIRMINLDVTDLDSVQSAVSMVLEREGRLDALVNNAGYGIAGAVEDTEVTEAASQFDTNFFGVLALCREALPALAQSKGIIVNISSVAARLILPFQSMYSASKAAMEAMSEALRIEQRPFRVRVTMVEPGDTRTGFTAQRRMTANIGERYEANLRKSVSRMEQDEQNGASPEAVARVVCRVIESKNPPVRVAVGFIYKLFLLLRRLLPDRTVCWLMGKIYG